MLGAIGEVPGQRLVLVFRLLICVIPLELDVEGTEKLNLHCDSTSH